MFSDFHQEVLSLLQKNAHEGVGKIPSSLEEALREKSAAGLDAVVRDYHRLLGETSRIEWEWMMSLDEREFKEAELEAYRPKVYRGLPRVYLRDHLERSKVKEPFRNLALLKRGSIDRAIASLYPQKAGKVAILVWVIPDGFGDWIAACEAAQLLKENGHAVELIAVAKKRLPVVGEFSVQWVLYEGEPESAFFSEEIAKNLRKVDLILQIPTYFPGTEKLLDQLRRISSSYSMAKMEFLGEYGYLESSWFHPKSGRRSMGLHALEKGIFVKKMPSAHFGEIEHKTLLQWLFGTEMPGPNEIEHYQNHCRFHLAYLTTPIGGAVYLNALLKMWERDELDIDVCSPDLSWFIRWTEERAGKSSLAAHFGVKRIEIKLPERDYAFQLSEKGKTLRLLAPSQVSGADMKRLMSLSGDWVGVRGDQSFSEAVSAGKPFFYDGRMHARYFMKDLGALAENRLTGHRSALQAFRLMGQTFLWNLPAEDGDWVDETYFQMDEKPDWQDLSLELGACLQDGDAIAGFKKFCRIVTEEHNVAPFITQMVSRALNHRSDPVLFEEEKKLLNLYGNGHISLSTLVKNLKVRMMCL